MTKSKKFNRFLSVLLSAAMILSLWQVSGRTVRAEGAESGNGTNVTWEKIENNGNGLLFRNKEAQQVFEDVYIKDGMIRVSILLEAAPALDKFPVYEIAANTGAKAYRQQLREQQYAMAEQISQKVLGGEKLDVVWNLTLVANIISANVPYEKIEEIRLIPGVKSVEIETLYEAADVVKGGDEPNMSLASTMVGGDYAWAAGFTGAGSKVAIIDTGIDLTHELFNGDAFEYALADLGKDVDLLTAEELEALWPELNIAARVPSFTDAQGTTPYKSSKIPFGANYASYNLDPTHLSGKGLSEHGSHVAGIAAANRFIPNPNGEGFVSTLDAVHTQGEAPDAQLLVMQTFGDSGTTSDADYMVAIEDAIWLGADSVNLSLGSSSMGFTTDKTYQDILDGLAQRTNLIWTGSAGNNYDWTESNRGTLYDDDVSYATGGSPNTYANTLSTASIDNIGTTGVGFTANDVFAIYNQSDGYSNAPMTTIAGEYEYIIIDGPGVDDNGHVGQDGDQFLALGREKVEGKVAFCFRGSSSFFAKANAAIAQGAVAVVIINNQAGTLNMGLTGYSYTAPVVSITQAEGRAIIANSEPVENEAGLNAYSGHIRIAPADESTVVLYEDEYLTMSGFSSWGVPGDLSLKPEITAPGGNIYSTNGAHWEDGAVAGGPGHYELMGGTSMAAPQMAGLVAVVAQYIRENDLVAKTGRTQRQLALSLLMSTSVPVIGEDGMYSILKQGSGLANIENAINARSYVTIDEAVATAPASAATSIADGKVKVELGQVLTDKTTATFSLHNFSDEAIEYYLNADFFTQAVENGSRLQKVTPLNLAFAWTVDGQPYEPTDVTLYDFNGDGVANGVDAQFLLDFCASLYELNDFNPNSQPDIDQDGDIDTYDARLAFEMLNDASLTVPAGQSVQVVLTISGLEAALSGCPNGNYIEGFIYATEGETGDGALGVVHSIPVLGFWGNWTDGSMFDKGSYVEYANGLEDRLPYMTYGFNKTKQGNDPFIFVNGANAQGFLVQYAGSKNKYFFGGNPVAEDSQYYPERNAISPSSMITDVRYTLIRNAAARRFFITNGAGKEMARDTLYIDGQAYGAYYYRSQSKWRNETGTTAIGYSPSGSNGTKLNLNFQAAPEYYVNRGIDWNELGKGSIFSIPFVVDGAAPTIVDVEEEATLLTVLAHDNEYIAAVALYTEEGEKVFVYGGLDGIRKAEQHSYEFNLAELFDGVDIPSHLLVEVYDYAANLSTYKVNFNKEELKEDVTLTLKETSVRILRGNTAQLEAVVSPWGAPDEVFWSSEDESIATVDEFGTVTAVAKGKTRIVCSYAEDPSIEAYCDVEVFLIPMTLIGVLQDEEGNPLYFSWDLENDDTWTPLGAFPEGITAMTLDPTDSTHAYIQDWNGDILEVSLETDEVLNSFAGADMFGGWGPLDDMAMGRLYNEANPDAHRIYGINNNYYGGGMLLYHHLGTETWGGYAIGGTLAGIAYEPGKGYDWYYLLDANGTMYTRAVTSDGKTYPGTTFVTDLSFKVELMDEGKFSGNSMVEGSDANFYLAHFNGSTSEIYQLSYAGENVGFRSSYIGKVGDGVWPVVLLGAVSNNAGDGGNSVPAEPAWHAVRDGAELVEESAIELEFVDGQLQPVGGTDAVKEEPAAERPEKIGTTVTVEITAEELTYNGMVRIEMPDTVILESWESDAEFTAMNDFEPGEIIFAFVDREGFNVGETILTLKFSKDSVGTATITTYDINEDDENELVETVVFGPASHSEHTYGEPVWNWTFTTEATATASFVCPVDNDTQVLDATVTRVYIPGEGVFFKATVTFEGVEYETQIEVPEELMPVAVIEAEGAEPQLFDTLQDAIDAAEAGNTVMLLRDVDKTNVTVSKELILNLNGKDVSSDTPVTIEVTASGNLTINGNGSITGPTNGQTFDSKVLICVDGGKLTLVDGTYTATGEGSDGMYGVYILNGGTAIFEEPTIVSHFAAIGTNNTTAPATVIVNGGTYTAHAAPQNNEWWFYFCAPVYAVASGSFTFNGGTFNGYYGLSSRYADVNQQVMLKDVTINASSGTQVFVDFKTGSSNETGREIRSIVNTLTVPEGLGWVLDGESYKLVKAATVTFDSDGGTEVDPQTVELGTMSTEPEAPTKPGFTFVGWFLNGEKFDFETTPVTEDITLVAVWEEAAKATITSVALTMGDRIDANIYLKVPEEAVKAVITYSHKGWKVPDEQEYVFANMNLDDKGRYQLDVINIPVKELIETMTLQVLDENGTPIKLVMETLVGTLTDETTYVVSAADYANVVVEKGNEQERKQAKALLNYGSMVQKVLNHKTETLAASDEILEEMAIEMAAIDANPDFNGVLPEGDDKTNLGYQSLSLNMEGEIQILLRFSKEVTATEGGVALEVQRKSDGSYEVVIPHIKAKNMDLMHEVVVTDGTNSFTFQVCALTYANRILAAAGAPQAYIDLAKAMYIYQQETLNLFGRD